MSLTWRRTCCLLTLALAGEAWAHIKLLAPTEWVVTSPLGDPQKLGPCGVPAGTTGVEYVDGGTTVEAGSLLRVEWVETIQHPGHFRLSIGPDRSAMLDPAMTDPVGCYGASVSSPPVAPVVVDGLFTHSVPSPDGGRFEATIRVPGAPCERCTLQLLQYMEGHGAPCFYYHCAELRIVAPAADGGTDAGAGTPGDAGSDGGAGPAGDAGTPPDGGTGPGPAGAGCGCQGGGSGAAALVPLLALAWRRRRR